MDGFTTVFEVTYGTGDGANYLLVPVGIVLCIVGSAILIIRKKKSGRLLERFLLPVFLVGFGLAMCVIGRIESDYRKAADELITAYQTGRYNVEEGTIRVVHEQPKEGHDKGDIVLLNEKRFEIDSFRRTPAYHRTISNGGVLKEEAYARVYHLGGQILRIDVRTQPGSQELGPSDVPPGKLNMKDSVSFTWKDNIWIACITATVGLFLVRKIILFRYGYGIGLIDYGQDAKRLAAIGKDQKPLIRTIFRIVNILLPLLFVAALIGVFLTRVIFPPR